MDINKILEDLRNERIHLEEALLSLERMRLAADRERAERCQPKRGLRGIPVPRSPRGPRLPPMAEKLPSNTIFHNSRGEEVAGTIFDKDINSWRLSTVPVTTFSTEAEAIQFYLTNCDPNTGLMGRLHQ
jgi:hypothetical protein